MRRRDFLRTSIASGVAAGLATNLGGLRQAAGQTQTAQAPDTPATAGFFRILTGSAHTTAFPVGVTIASAISNPPGSRPCDKGGSCGVPGLIAVALTSPGSVANLAAVGNESIESGFAQADLVVSAWQGEGLYFRRAKQANLRVLASLYPETIHLVVRRGSGIAELRDLVGKRVSIDRSGSGTRFNAEIILTAYGVRLQQVKVLEVDPGEAADLMARDELDAFFLISGQPAPTVGDLTDRRIAELVPLAGKQIEGALRRHPFFSRDIIPARTYTDVAETETLSIGMQWVVPESLNADLAYEILRALWHPQNRRILDAGPAMAQKIRLGTALLGVSAPLHAGAERFYREMKLIT
ncbi:TAXI family TRAP transporter solute-binding subunit [Ferrovibrio sp.]|uniref:TAXI family TRAP transporter solute-binding subunit n=1 Tax=Ferrovibrio sp. TaxID=1917215 RepID=UPI00260FCF02|nr:TAXI family TRAP transporter solute-binding subunit [Ferrovibrio sp.]